ncbi:MAG: NAD(P)-dependent oxidoreductase [Elusimicrobia bacterium]|nr:NAD(P)-dependent oxidoreductase [Elusimicrobiota bacterium]
MKRALVTGATGYIGGRLAERLLQAGVAVHLVVRPGRAGRLKDLPGRPNVHEHDGSTAGMLRLVEKASPDTVFHLAALSAAEHRPEDVEPLVASNVLFGTQVVEASVRAGVARFVNTGSYWQHYESRLYNPTGLYAATKQAFEDILFGYGEWSSLRTVTLKLFDVYGPQDPRGKILGQLRQAARTRTPVKASPGRQAVDFVYIDDVVEAYLHAARLLEDDPDRLDGRAFAVRSSTTATLRELVALAEKAAGTRFPVDWGARPYANRQLMKPWRGPTLPGWRAKVGLEEGLRRTLKAAEAPRA